MYNLEGKVVDNFTKLNKIGFFMECFTTEICCRKTSKFSIWVAGWVLAIKSKHFRYFLEICSFSKILTFKLFGNSYIHFLVIMI